ncbi:hypothetical protein K474DRAFT_1661256 [Panus rudis PR-1116 ss-1]|nr:hypothetical protein K474DRAFT_1661256 [Panus rudis PR-1116 ss-1]
MSQSSSYDISGLAIGVLTVVPGLYALLSYNLPSRRFKVLRKDFNETSELFEKVTEEGLLPEPEYVREVRQSLDTCHALLESYREKVYRAASLVHQCQELYGGLSRMINATCDDVRKIRANIVSKSNKERKRLEELHRSHNLSNPFGPTDVHEFGAYSQIIDCTFPARPSPIHSDVAVPLLRSVRRHSTEVSSLFSEQHSSTKELFLGQTTDPNIVFAEPASFIPVPTPNMTKTSPAAPTTHVALNPQQVLEPDSTIIGVATTNHADRPISRQYFPSASDTSKLSQLAILHQNLLSAAQAISVLHNELSLSTN